jgi:hypothetical protein
MKTKTILTFFCMMLFTALTHAQCTTSSVNSPELSAGQKVILAEISKEDDPEIHKAMVGKTLSVGTGGMANIGDCWFLGELNINGEDVFFVGVKLDAVKGETYASAAAAETLTAAASDFPVGSRVLVHNIPVTDKNSMSFYSDAPTQDRGDVIEADLVKNANGTYSGCILTGKAGESYRTRKCFTECKAEKTVY